MIDSYLMTLKILTMVEMEQIKTKIVILIAGFQRISSDSAVIGYFKIYYIKWLKTKLSGIIKYEYSVSKFNFTKE